MIMNTVQKFIFIQENSFNGSKLTFESSAETLDQILNDFTDFLRGSGFQINGYLDVINPEEELSDFHYDDPEANFDWPEEQTASTLNETDNFSLCPVCKIDNQIMAKNDCYDKNCPKDN